MRVEFLEKFNKDLDKVRVKQVKEAVLKTILKVEEANSLTEITHLKKIKGHKSAYRIRIGDYRIGIFVKKDLVQFGRIAHRKDIYKVFP